MASSVPQRDDVEKWSVEQVAAWLQQVELTECCEVFLRKGIDGHSLLVSIIRRELIPMGARCVNKESQTNNEACQPDTKSSCIWKWETANEQHYWVKISTAVPFPGKSAASEQPSGGASERWQRMDARD